MIMTPKGIINEMIEPPQVAVPMLGQENAITFIVETYGFNEVIITLLTLVLYLISFSSADS